jgi:hypothetical protein
LLAAIAGAGSGSGFAKLNNIKSKACMESLAYNMNLLDKKKFLTFKLIHNKGIVLRDSNP